MPDEEKLAAVREGLPAAGAGIYLNTGTCGPLPREAAIAMSELEGWELATGRAHAAFQDEALVRLEEARASIAAIVHADIDAIALTHGTTDGVNAALWSIDWARGDVLVTTSLEYPGVVAAIRSVAGRRGVEVRTVEVAGDDPSTLAAFEQAIDDRTRMVVLSHVVWSTGERLPVEGIARIAKVAPSRAIVVVDGAQSVGAIPIAVRDLGIDFLALPAPKWL